MNTRGPNKLWRVTYKLNSNEWRKKYYSSESDMLYMLAQEFNNPTLHIEVSQCNWVRVDAHDLQAEGLNNAGLYQRSLGYSCNG